MFKKSMFCVALASLVLATSCSQDDLQTAKFSQNTINPNVELGGQPISTFAAAKGKAVKSRAVETTITNLGSFTMNAFQDGEANYMKDVKYTSTDGSVWNTDAGTFYWPVEGNLHFYAYAPEQPGQAGTFKLDKDAQTLTDFVPNTAAADQKDFVYAKSTGNNKANGTTGIDIDFQHALSEVTIAAKNENTTYTVDVTGVKIGNVIKKGTFTFPSTSDAAASWTLSSDASDITDYTTTWTTPVTLGSDVSTLDATNVPFMILPQQLSKATKASEKAYIAVKVKITLQGGYIQKDDWVYVGIDTNWEMGKRYAYTLDFTSGAGQDKDGKQVISGTAINLNVDVTPWDEVAEDLDPSGVVPTRPSVANSLIIDPTSTMAYGINIADKINAFWSSAVGDQTTPIVAGTEWTAEVIWQDIPSRAINFCSKSGVVKSGDTFEGKGTTPLYVKAAANVKGNVVVGIKKKGESDYLWSWHLWLTDEPQLVAGFMDRNLGAESATATDGAKTRGLYYQFGRKDPFVGSTEIYDINGTSKSTGATIATGKVTFAKAVQTPATFYTYGSGNNDWASPNNYTSKNWNDISESDGKTFFDPCPEGWRLPTKAEYSNFSTTTFTWDATNSGRTYNGNWFPAAGYRYSDDGSMSFVGSYGDYWSASPYSGSSGYSLYFYSGSVNPASSSRRAFGFSVRCVQE